MAPAIAGGVHADARGRRDAVIGVARHSETGELFVVHVPLHGVPDDHVALAARPLDEGDGGAAPAAGRARLDEPLMCGVYEHYKGKLYLVLGVARHTGTGELIAVYVPLYQIPENEGVQMAVRPLGMFLEAVEDGGATRPRFRFTGEAPAQGSPAEA